MACPVCDPRATDGALCVAHRVMAEREPPAVLEKRTPPKPERLEEQRGHATVEMLSLLALFVFILLLLQALEFKW